jgi:hypothetical protein
VSKLLGGQRIGVDRVDAGIRVLVDGHDQAVALGIASESVGVARDVPAAALGAVEAVADHRAHRSRRRPIRVGVVLVDDVERVAAESDVVGTRQRPPAGGEHVQVKAGWQRGRRAGRAGRGERRHHRAGGAEKRTDLSLL